LDITLTEQQKLLKESAKRFLSAECPMTVVREMEKNKQGYSSDTWKKMADLGWLGLALDKEFGGHGGSFVDTSLIVEQMGFVLLPSPFIGNIAASMAIKRFGSEEQQRAILPAISRGDLIVTVAMYEPGMNLDETAIGTRAEERDNDYLVFGEKAFVKDVHVARYILTAARTSSGTTTFLIDSKSAEVVAEPLEMMTGEKTSDITFKGVRVGKQDILGSLGGGWRIMEEILRDIGCLVSIYSVGASERTWNITRDYTKQRTQFGKPIGNFQAIQHKLADMLVLIEGAKLLNYEAAWKISNNMTAQFEVAAAKAWTADAFHRVAEEAMRIHASMGYSLECDIQLFYRRATALKAFWGDPNYHRDKVARFMGI
jgi:alkylation response protein AidB-like acyl-CoA dehydrogenase